MPGAARLPFAFPNGFDPAVVPHTGTVRGPNQRLAFDAIVAPHLPALKAALRAVGPPEVESESPHLLTGRADGGAARYQWVVNNLTVRDEKAQFVCERLKTTVRLTGAKGATYDVFAGRRADGPDHALDLAEGDAKPFATLPRPVAGVELAARWEAPFVVVSGAVTDGTAPIPGVLPVELELIGPDGARVWRGWRATRDGAFADRWPLGHAAAPGDYRVRVTDRLAGKTAERVVAVPAPAPRPLGTGGAVEVFDRAALTALFRPGREVVVLVGDAAHHAAEADRLAAAPAARGVTATVEPAAAHAGKDKLDNPMVKGQVFPFFNGVYTDAVAVNKDAVVLGSPADNPLTKRLVAPYDLTPWKFRPDDPAPGRAVVWRGAAAFGLEHEFAAVCAADAAGRRRGVDALLAGPQRRYTGPAAPATRQPFRASARRRTRAAPGRPGPASVQRRARSRRPRACTGARVRV